MNEPCFIATFRPEVSVSEGCRFNQAQSTKVHCTFSLSIVAILIDFDAGSDQKGIINVMIVMIMMFPPTLSLKKPLKDIIGQQLTCIFRFHFFTERAYNFGPKNLFCLARLMTFLLKVVKDNTFLWAYILFHQHNVLQRKMCSGELNVKLNKCVTSSFSPINSS